MGNQQSGLNAFQKQAIAQASAVAKNTETAVLVAKANQSKAQIIRNEAEALLNQQKVTNDATLAAAKLKNSNTLLADANERLADYINEYLKRLKEEQEALAIENAKVRLGYRVDTSLQTHTIPFEDLVIAHVIDASGLDQFYLRDPLNQPLATKEDALTLIRENEKTHIPIVKDYIKSERLLLGTLSEGLVQIGDHPWLSTNEWTYFMFEGTLFKIKLKS